MRMWMSRMSSFLSRWATIFLFYLVSMFEQFHSEYEDGYSDSSSEESLCDCDFFCSFPTPDEDHPNSRGHEEGNESSSCFTFESLISGRSSAGDTDSWTTTVERSPFTPSETTASSCTVSSRSAPSFVSESGLPFDNYPEYYETKPNSRTGDSRAGVDAECSLNNFATPEQPQSNGSETDISSSATHSSSTTMDIRKLPETNEVSISSSPSNGIFSNSLPQSAKRKPVRLGLKTFPLRDPNRKPRGKIPLPDFSASKSWTSLYQTYGILSSATHKRKRRNRFPGPVHISDSSDSEDNCECENCTKIRFQTTKNLEANTKPCNCEASNDSEYFF